MVVLLAEAGPGPRPLSQTTEAPKAHNVQGDLWAGLGGGRGLHVSCDIVHDVTPHGTADRGWDNKSLCVVYCRQVTLWDCV